MVVGNSDSLLHISATSAIALLHSSGFPNSPLVHTPAGMSKAVLNGFFCNICPGISCASVTSNSTQFMLASFWAKEKFCCFALAGATTCHHSCTSQERPQSGNDANTMDEKSMEITRVWLNVWVSVAGGPESFFAWGCWRVALHSGGGTVVIKRVKGKGDRAARCSWAVGLNGVPAKFLLCCEGKPTLGDTSAAFVVWYIGSGWYFCSRKA